MGASGVIVDGQKVVIPGAYSEVDVSAAAVPGVLAAGVPCLVGTAEDGEPQTVIEFNSLDELRKTFRSGDIREAAEIVYDAVRDNRVNGRPTKLFAVKVNNDTQSVATFNSASGAAMLITSKGYGAFTERISVNILSGTNQGISLTIQLDDLTETVDDLGGDDLFSLAYSGTAVTMTATVDSTGLFAEQTFTQDGLDDEIIVTGFTVGVMDVISTSVYDDFQTVTVYGLSAGNVPISESIVLNGTSARAGTTSFSVITGVSIDGMLAGTVTVRDVTPDTSATFTPDLAAIPTAGILGVYSSGADVGITVNIRGRSAIGTPLAETVTLNGASEVNTAASFTKVEAVVVTGVTAGTITIEDVGDVTIASLTPGTDVQKGLFIEQGIRYPTDLSFSGVLGMESNSTSTQPVVIRGVNSAGQTVAERVVLTGTANVLSTNAWKSITQIEMGAVESLEEITFDSQSFEALIANGYGDFTVLDSFVNSKPGFTFTLLESADRVLADADYVAAVDITASAGFTADLATVIAWITDNSQLVTAARSVGGSGIPLTLATPTYLVGGSDATPVAADYNSAFTLLESTECDYVCALSSDAAVRAFSEAHAIRMAGPVGRSERMIYAGLPVGTTKTDVRSAAVVYSTSRHMNILYQEFQKRNALGYLTWYEPKFLAALQMGAQASARRGTPLTAKRPNLLNVRQDSTIDPKRDAAFLINAGISNIVPHPKLNWVWQRTMTTYTQQELNAFQESSANDALNASLKDLRQYLEERIVGNADVEVSTATIKSLAEARLTDQISSLLISDARNVTVVSAGTAVEISYEVAPALPRNFVVLRAHLFEPRDAA